MDHTNHTTTAGSRAFPVAASLIWNSLPDDVISAESLPTFQRKLKRHLFCQSFRGFCYWHLHLQQTLQWRCHLGHSKNTLIDWYMPLLPSRKATPPFGWYSLHLPTKGWPGWVDLGGWSHTEINVPYCHSHPSQY